MRASDSKRTRVRRLLLTLGGLLTAGGAYALLCSHLGWGLPCPIYSLTGLQCPGCGVSRMAISLIALDFQAAWNHHPAIMSLLPWMAAVAIDYIWGYIQTGTHRLHKWANLSVSIMTVILLVYGVVRNLPFGLG